MTVAQGRRICVDKPNLHNSDFSTSYDASEEKADNEWSRSQGKSADSEITRSSRRKLKKKRISNAIVQLNEETTYKQSYVDEITNGMCIITLQELEDSPSPRWNPPGNPRIANPDTGAPWEPIVNS